MPDFDYTDPASIISQALSSAAAGAPQGSAEQDSLEADANQEAAVGAAAAAGKGSLINQQRSTFNFSNIAEDAGGALAAVAVGAAALPAETITYAAGGAIQAAGSITGNQGLVSTGKSIIDAANQVNTNLALNPGPVVAGAISLIGGNPVPLLDIAQGKASKTATQPLASPSAGSAAAPVKSSAQIRQGTPAAKKLYAALNALLSVPIGTDPFPTGAQETQFLGLISFSGSWVQWVQYASANSGLNITGAGGNLLSTMMYALKSIYPDVSASAVPKVTLGPGQRYNPKTGQVITPTPNAVKRSGVTVNSAAAQPTSGLVKAGAVVVLGLVVGYFL